MYAVDEKKKKAVDNHSLSLEIFGSGVRSDLIL